MKLPAKKNSTNIIPLQLLKMQHPEKKNNEQKNGKNRARIGQFVGFKRKVLHHGTDMA